MAWFLQNDVSSDSLPHFLRFLLKPLVLTQLISVHSQTDGSTYLPSEANTYDYCRSLLSEYGSYIDPIKQYFLTSALIESCNFSNINLDLTEDLFDVPQPFLNVLSESRVQFMLNDLGILDHLKSHGFFSLKTFTDTSDTFVHRLKIVDSRVEDIPSPGNFLLDIWLRKRPNFQVHDLRHARKEDISSSLYDYLTRNLKVQQMTLIDVEWICLQNPLKRFSSRPQLPGQHFPGLRLGRKTEVFLEQIALEVGASGLICLPEHFHNAFLNYRKGWRFFNPAYQGWFESLLQRFVSQLSDEGHLAHVAWAIQLKLITNSKNAVLTWTPQEQMFPLGTCLRDYFASAEYHQMVREYRANFLQTEDWFFDAKHPSLTFLQRVGTSK